jgi:predicted nuclease with TOPRIM domain
MPKINPREKLVAWRDKSTAEVAEITERISEIVKESKKVKTDLGRLTSRLGRSSQVLHEALAQGVEDRRDEIMGALIGQHGEEAAEAMFDEIDTSREDERDETAMGQIDELSYPDPEDDLPQAIESLELLEDAMKTLLSGIRAIR